MEKNLRKFSEGKCRVLHPWRNNPMHKYRQGPDPLESNRCGIRKRVAIRAREVICPVLCPGDITFEVLGPVPGSPMQERQETAGEGSAKGYQDD